MKISILCITTLCLLGCQANPQQYNQYNHRQYRVNERLSDVPVIKAENLYFVLHASNLPSKDANGGVADPYVKVHYGTIPPNRNKQGYDLDILGETETIINENNPKWLKVFKIQYNKGFNQKLWVEVVDHDPINPDDVIGSAFIDLDEYMENGQALTIPLKGTKSGSIIVQNTAPFQFSLELKNIPSLDEFGGLSDPYVKCYFRYGKDGKDLKFHETVNINNVDKASWDTPISFDNYQRGTNQIFHFKVKDSDSVTADDDIGEAFMELDPFVDKKMNSVLPLSSSSNATLIVKWTYVK